MSALIKADVHCFVFYKSSSQPKCDIHVDCPHGELLTYKTVLTASVLLRATNLRITSSLFLCVCYKHYL